MASINLNALTENTSRLGARIQETIIEHTRELALSRSAAVSHFDAPEEKVRNIRKQLDASSDREKLDALKTLIALVSKGRNVSEYFAAVVKNVASPNLEIRKLVYIYLLRYAEVEPDLALLSINTFQRDLADANPLIRAMALRVLSGINVPMVENIVILAVKKCSADPSPYVRKSAALAVIRCHSTNASQDSSLIPIIANLLKEKSPLSIGAIAVAFMAVCPTRLDLLHSHYRRLCRMLIDADAWGQVNLLHLLARYARSMLSKPPISTASGDLPGAGNVVIDPDLQLLLTNAEPLFMSQNPAVVMSVARAFYYLAPLSQLGKVVDPLLRLLPISFETERAVLPSLFIIVCDAPQLFQVYYPRFIIRTSDIREVKANKLRILLKLVTTDNYQTLLREFVVYGEDPDADIASEAIKAIGHCARLIPDSTSECLASLMEFIKKGTGSAAASSVLVLKSLVQDSLQAHTGSSPASESVLKSSLAIISDLAQRIDEIRHPAARACVIWLVGQYATVTDGEGGEAEPSGMAWWAPDVLRRVAKTFAAEDPIVKLQALTLAAKLQVLCTIDHHVLAVLTGYVFSLARFDTDFDVRDRARMLTALLVGVSPHLQQSNGSTADTVSWDSVAEPDRGGVILRREQVRVVLFEGKLSVHEGRDDLDPHSIFGSMELITGKSMGLDSGARLPEWPDEGTDSSLRDVEEEYPSVPVSISGVRLSSAAMGSASGFGSSHISSRSVTPVVLTPTGVSPNMNQIIASGKGAWTDLDKFYEDAKSEESSEEDEDGDEDEAEEAETTMSGPKAAANVNEGLPGSENSDDSGDSVESEESEDLSSENQ